MQTLSLPDPFDNARLLRSVQNDRYFLVPLGTPLPAGTFRVSDENGKRETLKLGKLALWEITEESAGLILQHRAAAAGTHLVQVLNSFLSALDIDGSSADQAIASFAKVASPKPEHRAAVQARIQAQLYTTTDPLVRQNLQQLAKALRDHADPDTALLTRP